MFVFRVCLSSCLILGYIGLIRCALLLFMRPAPRSVSTLPPDVACRGLRGAFTQSLESAQLWSDIQVLVFVDQATAFPASVARQPGAFLRPNNMVFVWSSSDGPKKNHWARRLSDVETPTRRSDAWIRVALRIVSSSEIPGMMDARHGEDFS